MRGVRQDLIMASAKHLRQVQLRLHVNRQGIGVDAHLRSLTDGLPHIGNAVAAFIAIIIGGFAVADQQQQSLGGLLLLEQMDPVSNGRANTRISCGFETGQQRFTRWPRLGKLFQDDEATVTSRVTVKTANAYLILVLGQYFA